MQHEQISLHFLSEIYSRLVDRRLFSKQGQLYHGSLRDVSISESTNSIVIDSMAFPVAGRTLCRDLRPFRR